MSKETERTREKEAFVKSPYALRKLIKNWLLALFLMLLVFPLLGVIAPLVQTLTLFGMIGYTILFLLKRKKFSQRGES